MNNNEFNQSREELFSICKGITDKKGRDYTKGNHDVLSHFSESASSFGMTKYQNLGTFLKKHIDAIYNYIKSDGQSESEPIQSRIADAINFLTFFNAMVLEDNKKVSSLSSSNDIIVPHFFTFAGTDSITTKIVEMFNDRVTFKQVDISEYTNKLVTSTKIYHPTPVFESCVLNGYNQHDVLPVIKDNLSKYFNLLKNIITEEGSNYTIDYRIGGLPANGISTIQLYAANKELKDMVFTIEGADDISKKLISFLSAQIKANVLNINDISNNTIGLVSSEPTLLFSTKVKNYSLSSVVANFYNAFSEHLEKLKNNLGHSVDNLSFEIINSPIPVIKISSTHDISKVIYKLLRSETESNLINGTNLTLPLSLNVDIVKIDAIDDHIFKGTSKLVEPITGIVFSIGNLDANYTKQLSELDMNKRIFFNINNGVNVTDIYTKPKNTVNVVEYLGKSRIDNSPLFAIYIV